MINILYFSSIRDRINTSSEEIKLPTDATVSGVLEILKARDGVWTDVFSGKSMVLTAINQIMAKPQDHIKDGDEVAFFPPVTGG